MDLFAPKYSPPAEVINLNNIALSNSLGVNCIAKMDALLLCSNILAIVRQQLDIFGDAACGMAINDEMEPRKLVLNTITCPKRLAELPHSSASKQCSQPYPLKFE